MSAPLPDCSRTMAMMAKHMNTCRIVSAMTISASPLSTRRPAPPS
jgi:hypothetical protein